MPKGTIVDLKNFSKPIEFISKNNILIVLTVFFLVGLSFGIFSIGKYPVFDEWNNSYLNNFIDSRMLGGFLNIAVKSFFTSMIYVVMCFVFGASMLGVVLVPFVIAFMGFTYGGVTALLYATYSLKGIAIHAVLILPFSIIFVTALLIAAKQSLSYSLLLANLTLPRTAPQNLSFSFKNYCIKYLFVIILVIFSAIVDAVISGNFLETFNI